MSYKLNLPERGRKKKTNSLTLKYWRFICFYNSKIELIIIFKLSLQSQTLIYDSKIFITYVYKFKGILQILWVKSSIYESSEEVRK